MVVCYILPQFFMKECRTSNVSRGERKTSIRENLAVEMTNTEIAGAAHSGALGA